MTDSEQHHPWPGPPGPPPGFEDPALSSGQAGAPGYYSPPPTGPGGPGPGAPFTEPPPPWAGQAPYPVPYPLPPYPPPYPPLPPAPPKSAAAAVALSFLWPGLGHLYLGKMGLGVAFILVEAFWFLISWTIIGLFVSIPAGYLTVLAAAVLAAQEAQSPNRAPGSYP